jgi:LacI family transcriptional regulator
MKQRDLPPTQTELARFLGMAQSTVSLALRAHPSVSDKTREQVLQAAATLGYRPNPAGAALVHLRQISKVPSVKASLAWINGWSDPLKLRSYREFDHCWQGASNAAAELGYRLDEFATGAGLTMLKLERILRSRGVRGVMLAPGPLPPGWHEFDWNAFSVVRLSHVIDAEFPGACSVATDQVGNAFLAFQQLRRKGHRRIGFVGMAGRERTFAAGYLWAQQDMEEEHRFPPLVMSCEHAPETWEACFRAWFARHRPDAILTDIPLLPATLERLGVSVPKQVGVAALGILDCPISTGIDQNFRELGRAAVQMLHSLIKEGVSGQSLVPRELRIKGRWVDGDQLLDRNGR